MCLSKKSNQSMSTVEQTGMNETANNIIGIYNSSANTLTTHN